MAKLDEKIGFIGGGNMAWAIGSGLVKRGIIKAKQVIVCDHHTSNLDRFREIGTDASGNISDVLDKSDIIFMCVKPAALPSCAEEIDQNYNKASPKSLILVSVLAGVTLETLTNSFKSISGLKIIRTMPNTPMQVGEGCTVYCAGQYVTHTDLEKVHLLLNSIGVAQQVPEKMIDSVAAISGCGPAFIYTIIEALADGGVKLGVPRQMALQFAAQTVYGAAKTVLETEKHPAILRDEVCSPGGSTIAGVHELEKGGLRATLINAVQASAEKNKEMGRTSKLN